MTCAAGPVPKSFLAAFLTVIRPTCTVSRLAARTNGLDGLNSSVAKLFGQCFVAAVAVVSVVSNDFCHVHMIQESMAMASCMCKYSMDQLNLTAQQCAILYDAVKHYNAYVAQPNEMAVDNAQLRTDVKTLLQHIEHNTAMGTKRYKLVDGQWVPHS